MHALNIQTFPVYLWRFPKISYYVILNLTDRGL